jgi:hypothetical protein
MKILRLWLVAGLAMIPLHAVAADALPRVFFSPQERAEIVQRRNIAVRTPPGAAVPAPGAVAAAATTAITATTTATVAAADGNNPGPVQATPPVLRLEGLSIASSGATFAWISGQRYANGARLAGHRLDISAQGVVMVDSSGRSRRIRVGETLNGPVRTAAVKP